MEREEILSQLARDEPEVHREVVALLEGERLAGSRITAAGVPLPPGEPDDDAGARIGTRVGSWELDGFLARGGMGSVFSAHRATGDFRQEAAVKILQPGAGGSHLLERFQAERRILAGLDHPNIARLLDGGVTEDGHPWFAMDRVDGLPLTEHARRYRLPLDARLRLLIRVCEAVDYAHRNLVVHRDLKPGNILVTEEGVPKLLDFGIAKLLTDEGAADTELTRAGMQVLTPAYAAPEQVAGESVTTATDTYALGLLLYELLTEQRAHPAGVDERALREAILTTTPVAPSRAASGTGETAAASATATWARRIRGDLDLICMKALRKEPDRRYPSAAALREDLQRFLQGRTVAARPDTFGYRARKFVRRNRGAVGSSVLTMLSIVGFAASSAWQAHQLKQQRDAAELERDKARAVTDFLVDVFDATDPNAAQGEEVTARQILDAGGARVRAELSDQPEVQGAIMAAIGEAYRKLAVYDSAQTFLEAVVDRTRESFGDTSPEYAQALFRLGILQRVRRNLQDAEATAREVLALRTSAPDTPPFLVAEAWNSLGLILHDLGRMPEAEEALLEAQEIQEEILPPTDEAYLSTLGNLGSLYVDLERHEEAADALSRTLEGRRALHGDAPHMEVAFALNNLGSALQYGGRLDEALPYYVESLEIREQLLEPDHPSILVVKNNLATLYMDSGEIDRAMVIYREIADAYTRRDEPIPRALVMNNAGVALQRAGRSQEALEPLEQAARDLRTGLGPDHPNVSYPLQTMADALVSLDRTEEAERLFIEALDIRRRGLGPDNPNSALTALKLGTFYLDRGRYRDAEPLLQDVLRIRREILEPGHRDRIQAAVRMARLREEQGRVDEAREYLQAAADELRENRPDDTGLMEQLQELLSGLEEAGGPAGS